MRDGILLLIALVALVGCGGDIEPGQSGPTPATIKGLTIAPVGSATAATQRVLSGTVEALDRSVLQARLPGRVAQVQAEEGQTVRAGAPLIALADETASSDMQVAAAGVQAAEGQLAEAVAHRVLADKTLQRFRTLHAGGAVTDQEFDRVRMEEEAARQRVRSAEAHLDAARSRLQGARVMAGQARVTAPFDARVTRLMVDVGSTVLPGTPLVELDRIGPWRVRVEIPEQLAGRFRLQEAFEVAIPSLGRTLPGKVAEVQAAADPVTRTVTVKLALPEDAGLKSGPFAKVALPEPDAQSLRVPASAIVTRGQLTAVYVVQGQELHYRLVRVGATTGDRTEVLAGLTPGERIVVAGATRARHGARVEE